MSPVTIGWIVFACVFGGALIGMTLRRNLPEHHLSADSKDVIKMGTGLTATMAALVLALLIASAKSSYDAQRNELTQFSANVILIDRGLAHYGPEAKGARDLLRSYASQMLDQLWGKNGVSTTEIEPTNAVGGKFYDNVEELSPQNEVQRSIKSQVQKVTVDLAQTRLLLFEQGGSSIPMPFLVLLVFWVTIIFLSFGLFAPPNATVIATLFLCALSVSGAIFLILELDRPFAGLIEISDAPLRNAIAHLGR
jgi:Protein of unknown function (DUF4239)